MPRSRILLAVVAGGLLAGVLDIVYAISMALMRGGSATKILHAIASGVLGKEAYQGGTATAVLGLALHMAILLVAAAVYALAYRRIRWMQQHVLLAGAAFGVLVYLFMNFVVLPLSAVPFQLSYPPLILLQGFVSHALVVGLPIALILHYLAGAKASAK